MRRTWIEIDTDALRANVQALRRTLSTGCEPMLVVKGNAYGHGLLLVARCAWSAGVKIFVTDGLEASAVLRKALPQARLVLDGPVEENDVPELLAMNVTLLLFSETQAMILARRAMRELKAVPCHALVDTGMGALGIPWRQAGGLIPKLARLPGLKLVGLCSCFAGSAREDRTFADVQAARFRQVERVCREAGVLNLFRHLSDGGGLPREAAWDWDGVRVGALAYGYGCGAGADAPRPVVVRPVLSWRARLIQVAAAPCDTPVGYGSAHIVRAQTRLGTFAAGFTDGFRAALGGRAHVLCGGRRVPVVGNVAMRWAVADLGPQSEAAAGDCVTLIGRDGDASVWADELAALCHTLPHEILTGIRGCIGDGPADNS